MLITKNTERCSRSSSRIKEDFIVTWSAFPCKCFCSHFGNVDRKNSEGWRYVVLGFRQVLLLLNSIHKMAFDSKRLFKRAIWIAFVPTALPLLRIGDRVALCCTLVPPCRTSCCGQSRHDCCSGRTTWNVLGQGQKKNLRHSILGFITQYSTASPFETKNQGVQRNNQSTILSNSSSFI